MALATRPDTGRSNPTRSRRGQGPDASRGASRPPGGEARPHPRWLTDVPPADVRRGDGEFVREFISGLRIPKDSFAGRAGEPFVLRAWQAELLDRLFARRSDGRRAHRTALVGTPRKNGKTGLVAGVALYGLTQEDAGAEVYSVAGDRDQAKLVFGAARRMVELDPDLSTECRLFRDAIEHVPSGSVYRAVSAEAPLKEGLSPTLTIIDEVHVIDEDLYNVFALAMGARIEPLLLGITTAGVKADSRGRATICYRLYEYGIRVATHEVIDPSFYIEWWGAPESADHRDEATWRIANPGYDDILDPADLRTAIGVVHENEFRTKRLNQWSETIVAWLPHGAWEAIARPSRAFDPAEPFAAFLDGSWANDSTGIVACTLGDPQLVTLAHWMPDAELGHIDMGAVEARAREVLAMPGCRELAFDPRGFQDLFARFEAEGLPVVAWPTNSLERMVPACAEFERAVLEHRIGHDGDPRLATHVGNAVLKEDRHGPRIVKESKSSQRKIDLAVCAVGAYAEARRLAAEVVPTSVYETRGFLILGQETE